VVLLHGSPANSEVLLSEMAALSPFFTCYGLDMPGFGDSDPLPQDLIVADLGKAIAAAMEALGLPPCPVYGTHSGAAVAAELGVGWPERVTGLVMDGFPAFTEAEIAMLFDDYFKPFPPDALGGHLTSVWIRFRDQFTWFPWSSRDVTRLNPVDRPTPEDVHRWVMMYYRAQKTHVPAYRAICRHGQGAIETAKALKVRAVYLASAEDMLFGHLDRLPALKDGQSIVRVKYDPPAKFEAIRALIADMPSAPAASPPPRAMAGSDPGVQFFGAADSQIFVRCYGNARHPAIFLLHDAPGSGLALESLARKLSRQYYVILPDLPGNGDSDAPMEDASILEAGADAVFRIAAEMGIAQFEVAATGCGCAVAVTAARRRDPRLRSLFLEAPVAADAKKAAAIVPELHLSADGGHWIRAWLIARDNQIYKPWFDGSIASQRRAQGNFNAEWLHRQAFELMKARLSYHRLAQEAYGFDCLGAIAQIGVPVDVLEEGALAAFLLSAPSSA